MHSQWLPKTVISVSIAAIIDSEHGFCLLGTAVCTTLSSRCLRGHGRVPSAVLPVSLFVGNSRLRDTVLPYPAPSSLLLLPRLLRVLCYCSPAPWKSSVEIDPLALGRAKPGLVVLPLPRHARPRRQRAETRFWKTTRPRFALPRGSGCISTLLFWGAGEQHLSTCRRRGRRSREIVAVKSNWFFF